MKKIFSLLVMLVMTATAFAQSTSEKIIPDGTQPNGGTITPKAITVDWATQKIVANVDLTNCLTGTNEQIFAISTNSADIANWDQESGSTLHFFYRQNFTDWGSTTADVHKFAVQYRYKGDNGATNRFYEVRDISNCTIVMDKEGVHIDGTLVFEASLMPQLYKEGANQLYFGSLRGEHPYATYKSVELVTEGGTTPGETATYEITDNAMTMYVPSNNGEDVQNYTQYMKDAKLQVEKDAEGKYTVTFNDVVAGKNRESLGNIVFAGLDAQAESEDLIGVEIPQGRVCTIYAEGSSFDNHMFRVVNGSVGIVPPANEGDPATAYVKLSMSDDDGNMLAYKMGDVFIPIDHNFTSDAYVKVGDQTTNFANSEAVLTEFMEDVYKVTFKNITIGEKTGDFTVENLEPTEDADGNLTFTASDTYGFWNDADETELDFTDFSASVKVGENGFEGFVCKFTTENGQFVYGEKAETPEPPSVVETKIFSDKLEYTLNTASGTNDPQKLTIESLGNDRYNVILANLDTYNVLYVNVGTVSFKNVAGKTENGITTIEAEKPEVTFTDADYPWLTLMRASSRLCSITTRLIWTLLVLFRSLRSACLTTISSFTALSSQPRNRRTTTLSTSTRTQTAHIIAVPSTASLSSRQARTSRQRALRLQRLLTRIILQTNRSQLRLAANLQLRSITQANGCIASFTSTSTTTATSLIRRDSGIRLAPIW